MRIKSILFATGIALLAMGCSKQNEEPQPTQNPNGGAFLSVKLNNAGVTNKVTTEAGSADESTIASTTVLLFDGTDKCIGSRDVAGVAVGTASTALEVPLATEKAFVVLNNYTTGWDLSEPKVIGKTWSVINTTLTGAVIANIATANKFMMANAGDATNAALTPVTITKPVSNSSTDIAAAKTAAQNAPTTILVDRLSSKVYLETKPGGITVTPAGAAFTFQGWELNVTNRSTRLYSDLVPYAGATSGAVYRQDANYLLGEQPALADMNTAFNYLKNGPTKGDLSPVALADKASTYCLENTMEAVAQKLGYTTKAVLKGAYTPNGITAGESYFSYQNIFFTIDQVKAAYASNSTLVEKALKTDLPIFLKAAGIIAPAATPGEIDAAVAALAEGPGANQLNEYSGIQGRYKAVTYFHKSVCYYDILIQHDQAITTKMALGRYGVVRNNWYKLTVNSVKQPGTPWIPDPTDPEDPTDPDTDDDEGSAFLSVSITINPWTVWTQGVDL